VNIREQKLAREYEALSPFASKAAESKGRITAEEPCPVRTCFERDRDRILHSKAFRRLMHKTQVFIAPEDDHYRTRLTHTLEVSQIARSISVALRLNEALTEAIALGHDLGHTPFGHSGEEALNEICPFSFEHNLQSLRIVEKLENGTGLNLTWEVRDGIKNHCSGYTPSTLEGKVVYFADKIAYINHDIDDAIRAGILTYEDIPSGLTEVLGSTSSERINAMIMDIVENSEGAGDIKKGKTIGDATAKLRDFLFERVYIGSEAKAEEEKAQKMLQMLYTHFTSYPEAMPQEYQARIASEGVERIACDYIAGMTDTYAVKMYTQIFVPKSWT